ncbi:hypothetical protein SADUNF_Sadunf19G0035100 [Salix dunnii]|uniref:Uncharacterized protein n=1 Tax=Salix dunnii TaxID=1413687 RepID=A0A835J3N6_9ROSI|nr:hypothetical protein SADUNF_Sadunf19G0035100 [Salix dunnii]
MEGVPPSFMDDDVNQLDLQAQEDNFNMSELPSSPAEEDPVNQSSMLCNDRAGQNMLVNINDTTQQTAWFPPSFPQTMMEGAPPSSVEDDFNFALNRLELETLMSELPSSPLEEVPVNQSSILCNDQGGQNMLVDNNDSTQFPPHNHQVSGYHDLLNSNCYDSMFFEPTSSSRIQCIPNQGQVDQASVIPNIDNMQQENFEPRNFGKSTRSQMENPQVYVLQNQTARPNASNPGPDSSLQSQNRGLNTQHVRSLTELSSSFYPL